MTFVAAPPGAYEIVLRDFIAWRGDPEKEKHHWEVEDIRLGWKSLREDFGPAFPAYTVGLPDGIRDSREEALERGRELVEWHRERHVWWTPAL